MRLIVDSACDLSLSYLEEHNIIVVPLSVIVDDKEYVDMFEIKNEQIYALIKEGKHRRTSQVPLDKFHTEFRKLAAEGESALYIALSSD
uniref:DegV family protein n=1 Tax=Jeotgalibaca porci TaxID=1868793 RepID=UPI0035A02C98